MARRRVTPWWMEEEEEAGDGKWVNDGKEECGGMEEEEVGDVKGVSDIFKHFIAKEDGVDKQGVGKEEGAVPVLHPGSGKAEAGLAEVGGKSNKNPR